MFGMFSNCKALTNLNLGNNFSTQNVTDMALMFAHCTSIKTLTLSNFDTSKVTDMKYMFSSCFNLKSLDLTSFSFQNNVAITGMFFDVGKEATNKPISIDMTPAGKAYIESKGDSGIYSSYAKII
jgi:surface protein